MSASKLLTNFFSSLVDLMDFAGLKAVSEELLKIKRSINQEIEKVSFGTICSFSVFDVKVIVPHVLDFVLILSHKLVTGILLW
jgi:hypothetical protein